MTRKDSGTTSSAARSAQKQQARGVKNTKMYEALNRSMQELASKTPTVHPALHMRRAIRDFSSAQTTSKGAGRSRNDYTHTSTEMYKGYSSSRPYYDDRPSSSRDDGACPTIAQLKEGLKLLGLGEALEAEPHLIAALLCKSTEVSADSIAEMLIVKWLSDGKIQQHSVKRKKEQATLSENLPRQTPGHQGQNGTATELLRNYASSDSQDNFLEELSNTPKITKMKVMTAHHLPQGFSSNKQQYSIQPLIQNLTTILSYYDKKLKKALKMLPKLFKGTGAPPVPVEAMLLVMLKSEGAETAGDSSHTPALERGAQSRTTSTTQTKHPVPFDTCFVEAMATSSPEMTLRIPNASGRHFADRER
ncbi:hypothetical protein Bbelb_318450 [Branchiostoma belcheri]|nr:hypothetical protein Bbelb_318450 [Branchiostoma belcheri]